MLGLLSLPDDVLQQTLEFAYHPRNKSNLVWFSKCIPLVCKRFNKISESIKYDTIIPYKSKTVRDLLEKEDFEQIALRIRNLDLTNFFSNPYLDRMINNEELYKVLVQAKNLRSIKVANTHNFQLDSRNLNLIFYKLPNIIEIELSGLNVSLIDIDLENDFNCKNLQILKLDSCEEIPNVFYDKLIPSLSNLKALNFTNFHSSGFSNSQFSDRFPKFASLKHLTLQDSNLTTEEIFNFFQCQSQLRNTLEELNLDTNDCYFYRFDSDQLSQLFNVLKGSKCLKVVNINGQSVDDDILRLLINFPLKSLQIKDSQVSLTGLHDFLENCPTLNYLNLAGVSSVNDANESDIKKLLSHSNILSIEVSNYAVTKFTVSGWTKCERDFRSWIVRECV